jgi:general secretion pathway protein I
MISKTNRGFTLIEVLVALGIVIVAFMAMYGSMIQVVAATTLMQEKTLATWIAFDRITDLRIRDEFPADSESSGEIEMGGIEWVYTINTLSFGNENVLQVIVKVAPALEPDNELGIATGVLVKPAAAPAINPGQGIRPGQGITE